MKGSFTDIKKNRMLRMQCRILLCAVLMVLPILMLLGRLWTVQVRQGPELHQTARRQTLRNLRITPVRGRIFDRDGDLLAGNISHYDMVFHLSEMRQPRALKNTLQHIMGTANRFSILLGRPHELEEKRISNRLVSRASEPVVVFRNLTPVEIAKITELSPPVAGVEVVVRNTRMYPHPGVASHLLGTTGWHVPKIESRSDDYMQFFALPELKGTSGLESVYNDELSGKGGEEMLQVEYRGYLHDRMYEYPAEDGHDLRLSLDAEGQALAEQLLEGHRGAFIVVDVKTGGILVMASSPSFDLSTLTRERYAELARDSENRPLMNRALDGQYTPGSIFKPLIGLAALEHGAITPSTRFDCTGRYWMGRWKIDCSGRTAHGNIDVVEAITRSCNGFFIDAGVKTGVDNMQNILLSAGIGAPTGIDFKEFAFGFFPSRDNLKRRSKRTWVESDTALLSIGQGPILVTPLQVAMYCAAIANGGRLLRPYLVSTVSDQQGRLIRQTLPVIRHNLPVSPENLSYIREGMEYAVSTSYGSARAMQNSGVAVAAKTGTAEVMGANGKFKNTWIMAYAPVEHPQYAIVCLVEEGVSGGKSAAPIAARFLKEWLSKEIEAPDGDQEPLE